MSAKDHDTVDFSLGLVAGEPGPGAPSVDFFTGAVTLLARLHGSRMVTQEALHAVIGPLGQVEQQYRALARVPKKRKAKSEKPG